MVTRRINTFDPVVVTITKIRAGTTNNVIPEDVVMEGTLRSVSERSRRIALDGIDRIVRGIAAAHEMEATFEHVEGYPVTINDAPFVRFTESVARRLLGEQAYLEMPAPVMGAEDFSYLLQRRPGAFAFLGVCPPDHRPTDAHACHSNRMTIDETALRSGVGMYCATALAFLAGDAG
jgi:hippurate hydrolase